VTDEALKPVEAGDPETDLGPTAHEAPGPIRRNPVERWLFAPVPLGRVAAFRTLVYLFVVYDVAFRSASALGKVHVAAGLYHPLQVARVVPIFQAPSASVVGLTYWALLVLAPIAAFSRRPRAIGVAVFLLYFEWMLIAMSYGKVDHDRLGFLVALALLPTIGRATYGDETTSESAGWVFRMVQLSVVATYVLAAYAKMRFGGVRWLWGSTLAWAIERRGTWFSRWLLTVPLLLQVFQVVMIAFEALSPLIFVVSERVRRRIVAGLYGFHVITALALTITFAPHLVAMTAFLPLEQVTPVRWCRSLLGRGRSVVGGPLRLGE